MRHLSSLLLALTLTALPLSAAHAEDAAKPTKATAAKHTKRKTASKTPSGAISVDKLKQEVAGRIKLSERESIAASARQHLEGAVAQVKAKLAGAVRDGKVTPVELKQVRDTYHLMAVKPAKETSAKPVVKEPAAAKKHAKAPKKKVVQGENDPR